MACEITAATKNTKQIQRRRWEGVNVDSSAAPPPGTSEWCISTSYNVRFGSAPDSNLPVMSSGSSPSPRNSPMARNSPMPRNFPVISPRNSPPRNSPVVSPRNSPVTLSGNSHTKKTGNVAATISDNIPVSISGNVLTINSNSYSM